MPIVSRAIVLVVVLVKCAVPIVHVAIVAAISIHATMETENTIRTYESKGSIAKLC